MSRRGHGKHRKKIRPCRRALRRWGDVERILNGDSSIPTPAIAAMAMQDNDLSEALHVLVCDMLPGILSTRGEEIYEALLAIDSAAGTLLV